MKKLVCLLSLICCLTLTGQAMAYSVSLTPNFQTIQSGSTGQVDVNLMLNPGETLFGFNFGLAFDPSILRFDNLLFGSSIKAAYIAGFTPPIGSENIVTFDGGLFEFAGITSDVTPLASLYFTGIGSGSSLLNLDGSILDFNALSEVAVVDSASMNVGSAPPVPEPATLLLLGSGLAGLLGFRKKYIA